MTIEWIKTARHGGSVQRAHTVPTIQKHYSNAEHTFNAIIIAKQICKDLDWKIQLEVPKLVEDSRPILTPSHADINEDNIVTYLLKHDLAESYTGDMPANFKKETDVKILLDKVESIWERYNVPKEYTDIYINPHELWIAKMADSLELGMFCIDEYSMGNRHEVFLHMVSRILMYIAGHLEAFPSNVVGPTPTMNSIHEELCKCL